MVSEPSQSGVSEPPHKVIQSVRIEKLLDHGRRREAAIRGGGRLFVKVSSAVRVMWRCGDASFMRK